MIAFTRQIRRVLQTIPIKSQTAAPTSQEAVSQQQSLQNLNHLKLTSARTINLFELPPHEKTTTLIEYYFKFTGLIYSYIHRETFLGTLERVRRQEYSQVRRTWLGMLNMMLALAINKWLDNGLSAEERAIECDLYYQRALRLCNGVYSSLEYGNAAPIFQSLLTNTETAVQYLLLKGQFLQGSQNSIEAWTNHGLAVRIALQLGLHSTEVSKNYSELEAEVRKRTWYGCVIIDRYVRLTLFYSQEY
jgi:hypothetical protein